MDNTVQQPLKLTDINMMKEYAKGTLVELPEFAEGMPFVARVRRPSMLAMVKSKKIPNSLLATANKLFAAGSVDVADEKSMDQIYELFDILCEATFVEPAWKDIKEAGLELTDEQYIAVFNYTQQGVKALEPFRRKPENTGLDQHGDNVQPDTE